MKEIKVTSHKIAQAVTQQGHGLNADGLGSLFEELDDPDSGLYSQEPEQASRFLHLVSMRRSSLTSGER